MPALTGGDQPTTPGARAPTARYVRLKLDAGVAVATAIAGATSSLAAAVLGTAVLITAARTAVLTEGAALQTCRNCHLGILLPE